MRSSGLIGHSGSHTSPGTPENGVEMPKPWSSERGPFPESTRSRRHMSSAAFIPFNSGRALPSKWDDAERWITSPISGQGSSIRTPVALPQRRPKSKSGPLGPPGHVYGSIYSPNMAAFDGGNMRNILETSPLTTGVLAPDGISIHYDTGVAAKCGSLFGEYNMLRSGSNTPLLDLQSEFSLPSSRDDKFSGANEEEALVSRGVYQRDTATQMSPEGSTHSSSNGRFSFSTTTVSIPSSLRPQGTLAAKDDIRDVQVDRGTTTSSQPKKRGSRKMKKILTNVEGLDSPWNASEASKNTSKLQREEAKITAWENLQKAKAEASIRELEMKLEKKRSASMDRIMNKLRAAQLKAESMRNSVSENHSTSDKRFSGCVYIKDNIVRKFFACGRN